ncbi:MAG: DUF58 domain-containing protein [Gemmatimonadaceae bacterium]|nr:DUF58 domain-containing protein [Gemmatimonadaceae bacterium]MCW5825615.1 DUF58 domain-containing protein [Gemmatimonadaceae bacterium]
MTHAATGPLRPDLMDPRTLAALGRLEVISRWLVDGVMTGLHRSPKKGFSVEFAEHRPYQPGDDLRFMDWKVAARADKWLIKQYEEETNLRATLVLDVSKSMDWASAPTLLTKRRYAEQVVAALALLLLRQRDAVGLIRFDDAVRTSMPPASRQLQFTRIVAALGASAAGPGSDAGGALRQAAQLVKRRGMVVLVSDLLVEPDEAEDAVRVLRAQGHDVVVLHLLDPAERSFAMPTGEALFVDPEQGDSLAATPSEVREAYAETVAVALDEWRARFAASGASYQPVLTSEPFGVPLRHAFARRQRQP